MSYELNMERIDAKNGAVALFLRLGLREFEVPDSYGGVVSMFSGETIPWSAGAR